MGTTIRSGDKRGYGFGGIKGEAFRVRIVTSGPLKRADALQRGRLLKGFFPSARQLSNSFGHTGKSLMAEETESPLPWRKTRISSRKVTGVAIRSEL